MRARNDARVTRGKITKPMPRSGRGAHPGHREIVAERQRDAINLRRQGASYRAIGRQLGISQVQALRDCMAGLNEIIAERQESAAQLLALELERLDWLCCR
jgi:hypothetical protein